MLQKRQFALSTASGYTRGTAWSRESELNKAG